MSKDRGGVHCCAARVVGLALGILLCSGLPWARAQAAQVQVTVMAHGKPLADAVVSLHSSKAAAALHVQPVAIDQRNTQFQPHVSVVHVGSPVTFPNSDNVRHQVYSFSPAKRFELPLYSGKPAAPIVFDHVGVVELGCNIHDWMLAYVVVVDTPYHAISDARGRVVIDAPPGQYRLQVWHERQPLGTLPESVSIDVPATGLDRSVDLQLGPPPLTRAPADAKLQELQERFRKLRHGK